MSVRRLDVANLAGTSPAVVSYVINGGPRNVAPETRQRVLSAIEQLGYRPNRIASSLRSQRTMTFGLIVPDMSNPFFAELARAIEEEAFRRGYTLLIGNSAEQGDYEHAYIRTFQSMQVDGLCIVPAQGSHASAQLLEKTSIPWITIDRHFGPDQAPIVAVDNYAGAHFATSHLIEHGRARIGCLAGSPSLYPAAKRIDGWRAALKEQGLPNGDDFLVVSDFGRKAGYMAAIELLGRGAFDAIFTTNDEQAIGVIHAIYELGRQCPKDIALVSFDGIDPASYSRPSLTTMAQPFSELGKAAVESLIDRLDGAGSRSRREFLPTTLVPRQSCGCR